MLKWLGLRYLLLFTAILPTSTSLCALCSWEHGEILCALCSLGSIVKWGAICRIVGSFMPLLSREQKHQNLVQLRSGVSTHKIVTSVGMSQSFVANVRKDVGGKIERQRRWRPRLLATQEKRCCVTLGTEGSLRNTFVTTKQLRF